MRSALLLAALAAPLAAQQRADTSFRPAVDRPAYAANGPLVRLDEAHRNFHTVDGRYAPFVALLRADGYRVEPHRAPFSARSLAGVAVLVIANAAGATTPDAPAFAADEVAAVRAWVERGGALLLVADHAPFGAAAESLGAAFGVGMGKGFARDTAPGRSLAPEVTFLRFTRDAGTLGDHPITRGLSTVVTFTGQSLTVPPGATPLLRLSATAEERPTRADLLGNRNDATPYTPVGGRAQGLAMTVGRGRVVVLGEAAMLSAQVIELPDRPLIRMGMNVPGTDDRQFARNVLRWLAGARD